MLVLTRKEFQRIFIDVGGVRITVALLAIRGDKVRLGFEAPAEVLILREEVQREDT